jgi:hypothetical protein
MKMLWLKFSILLLAIFFGLCANARAGGFYAIGAEHVAKPRAPEKTDGEKKNNNGKLPAAVGDARYPNAPGQQGNLRKGHLTPEERRALRRQINEAGQDLYPPRK